MSASIVPEAYASPDPAKVPWIWEKDLAHRHPITPEQGICRHVLFLDGHAEFMHEKDFQAMLKQGTR